MNKEEKEKPRVLTPEEGIALLGGEEIEYIGNVHLDPIGLRVLATRIGRRLSSKGGRPTDSSWDIYRKVPMKQETWTRLEHLAQRIKKSENRSISAGQLGAIALEHGAKQLETECEVGTSTIEEDFGIVQYKFGPEIEEEAEGLCCATQSERLWS
ncbi:MAG: hypothetical protein NTX50_18070 [Candidatus Sumerlaeota bacterium]|nr:hypothetical protein [Candidatus Sumerlaeota bacterium]